MKRLMAALLGAAALIGSTPVHAQDALSGTPRADVTIIPAGGTFFTESKDTSGPSFGNYGLGAGVTVNVNRYVGVEGEVSGALGVTQDLIAAGRTSNVKSPNLINYSGNLVVSAPRRSTVVPYVTAGVGGLSVLDTPRLGINGTETFLTGNVGAGLKWYAGRWGLRADYRFLAVRAKDNAPAFFGRETRYGHRVYGGLLLNIG